MKESLGKQLDYILEVTPLEWPDAEMVIRKVKESKGVIAPVEAEVEVADDDIGAESISCSAKPPDTILTVCGSRHIA